MYKRKSLLLVSLAIIVGIIVIKYNRNEEAIDNIEKHIDKGNEERPDQPVLSGEEEALFIEYLNSRQSQPNLKSAKSFGLSQALLKSAPSWDQSSYANGKLQGTWAPKVAQSGWYGYRVDNSAYDSLHNVFYVVSYAGHLYKLEYQDSINWTLLNHKIVMNPPSNSNANPVFLGTLLPDSTFRLIRSNDDLNRMEYSDDEGKTWNISTGAIVTQSWSNEAFEITNNGQKRIVLHTYYSGYHYVYISSDNGVTYTEIHNVPISTSDMRIVKPYFTNEVFMWVWSKTANTIDIYKFNPAVDDFELTVNSPSTLAGTNLSNAEATYYEGSYHFYLATINSEYTVYYSNDAGATWVQKNAGRDRPFEVMCADKPNILISGFEDMKQSVDYGTNWTGYSWKLGWDLQHMRTYEMAGGKHITLAGLDFGCYISETPEDKESYTWCNNGAWYAMHYDAATSENFNSIYMGNQDRGTTAYPDSGTYVNTVDVDGTDVLRVCFANHETSVWSWFYYGRIKHRNNFPTGKSGQASYDGLGNWWAAPIIASPDLSEDAIYAAYGSNLQKFTYDPESNSITKTEHPFNFNAVYKDDLGGFGYSELNRNLWYAATNNGYFLYSEDAGDTWTKSTYIGSKPRANDQGYNYAKNQIAIKASQIDTNKVFYAGVGNYFMVSEDKGKTFTVKNSGLNIYRMRDFDLSPDEKFVFAACGYGGAWVYSVDDDSWYQMSDDPIPSVDFTDVQFIHGKNCVRFSSYGSGILDFTLNNSFYPVDPPSNLSASIITYPNIVELNWTDNNTDEDGFYIERATNGDFVRIDTLGANSTTYIDNNTGFDKTCYYRVKAFKNDTASFKSNLAYISLPKEGILNLDLWSVISFSSHEVNGEYAPAEYAIDNNTATFWHTEWDNSQPTHPHYIAIDLGEESEIAGFRHLARQDGNNIGIIDSYEFYVTNDTSNWGTPVNTGQIGSGTSWKEVVFDQSESGRYVKLVALSEINEGIYTSAAEIAILYQPVAPNEPINLTSRVLNDYDVRLAWRDNSINELGYIIEQYIDGSFIAIDSVSSSWVSYFHRGLPADSTYKYRVRAYNNAGVSDPSSVTEITLIEPVPDAPTNLAATIENNYDIMLSWTDNSMNELGFIVEQLVNSVYVAFDTVDQGVTTFVQYSLPADSTYWYRVKAYNNTGGSDPTEVKEVTVLHPLPDAPISLTATIENNYDVRLTWIDNSEYELGYIIEQLINDDYISIDTVDQTDTTYLHNNLEPGTTFSYRVRAYNNTGASEPTNVAEVFTKISGVLYTNTRELKVYPNPVTTQLKIELPALKQHAILRVIDLNGKTYLSRNINPGTSSINLSLNDLTEGIYIVDLRSEGFRLTQKIRKE